MCGVVAVWGPDAGPIAEAMLQRIVHRGPDSNGVWVHQGIDLAIGAVVLSVVTPPEQNLGVQPLSDGVCALAYNGELYAWADYAHDDEPTDTHVLFRELRGNNWSILEHRDGPFSFLYWDGLKLHAMRDRYGVKSLYWCRVDRRLAIASEMKAFTALPGFKPEVNEGAVQEIDGIQLQSEALSYTVLRGVYRVVPGVQYSWLSPDTHSEHQVLRVQPSYPPAVPVPECLRTALQLRLQAARPIGMTVSGGLDSSILAYLAAELGYSLPTYTVVYDGLWNELQERTVEYMQQLGHTPKVVQLKPVAEEALPALVYQTEDVLDIWPAQDAVYRAMHDDGVVVSIDGHGADESFAGYKVQQLCGDNLLRRSMELTQGTLQHILRVHDMAAMSHSVESRAPFLQPQIYQFGLGLPREAKVDESITKLYLRRSFPGIPKDILWKPKLQGFYSPMQKWRRQFPQLAALKTQWGSRHRALAQMLVEELQKRCI